MAKKRGFCVSVVFLLVITMLLTACGSNGDSNNDNSVAEAETSGEEPLKITIITYNQVGYPAVDGTEVQKIVEERFNVDFDVIEMDIFEPEEFNLYFAQGGEADVICTANTGITELIDQGILREISINDLYEKMPTWMAKIEELVGDAELVKTLSQYNGKNYCIPYTHGPAMESGTMIVRKDWMENVGIDSVNSIEEFEELLDAFTYGDPDGNGVDDTYGIHGGQRYHFNYSWGAYGIMPDSYYVDNDEVIYTSITDEYKEVLTLLHKWYEAGYIDPEFTTDDRTMQRNKWSEGKFGVLEDNAYWCDSLRGESGVLKMLEAKNENATFEFLEPFEGPNGDVGAMVDFPSLIGDGAMYFGINASDEVVYKMMEIKEAMASDWDLYERCYYGVEGEDYTYENEILTVNAEQSAEDYTEKGLRHTWAMVPTTFDWMEKSMNERDKEVHSAALSQPTVYSGTAFPINGTCEALTIKGEDVSKIVSEYYFNAITGKIDIDSTWDAHVQEVLDAGLSDILAEYNEIRVK